MSTVAIFASYDQNGVVHDYVLAYLRYLRQVCDQILFIADNQSTPSEKKKLDGLADFVLFQKHGEYDFGSYKRGYLKAQELGWLQDAEELVLCNDSCFCVDSLEPIFEKMRLQETDFWGMTKSVEVCPHLQSFFLVFKKNVFSSSLFRDYLLSVTKQEYWDVVLKYETPLLQYLENRGGGTEGLRLLTFSPNIIPRTTRVFCSTKMCRL